jgi:ATP/maltotriose-dependent transcriptional regulator MalT
MGMPYAKATRPRVHEFVPRPRLFRVLDRARVHPVTWVWGPPGAGKTTLVSSYRAARKIPCLWYQVDEGDADVATFFYYLGEAASRATPRRRQPLPLLTPEYLPGLAVFTQRFFRDLFDRFKPPFLLVLDNYQEVPADSPFHEVMREALDQVPAGGHVICISRSGPPLTLARLRANQAMTLVTWDDIRFTPQEAGGLIRLVGRSRLARDAIHSLYDAADGWAAGLVLLLEQLKTGGVRDKPGRRTRSETLFDYFAGEVFRRTDRETQELLLQTAFLPRLTATMAKRLTGIAEAGRLLAALHRENYFTNRYGEGEPVYQYHPLFREFLLARGHATLPAARRRDPARGGRPPGRGGPDRRCHWPPG